ncbi:MAG TPA: hypothetical protein H9828_02140 [Candidatus Alistipes intestinigallinarum]|uniref:Uncharacterized protein n=1 Tax=Candidatus Alistipes intestinigallinarum TaxID=2838440 RepID=A0A9D1YZ46_9BACT|nr:hypothetical protein [Candidatus Alistipes intestinigallinarum]
MKKTMVMLAAMALMCGGFVVAQEPEKQEPPKKECPTPEEQPAPEPNPEEQPQPETPDQTPAEPESQPVE